jgi:hypothetical protein
MKFLRTTGKYPSLPALMMMMMFNQITTKGATKSVLYMYNTDQLKRHKYKKISMNLGRF